MIGHLQSRKAGLVIDHFDWLHSLDSLKLAAKLDRLAHQAGRKLPVLLEYNIGGEESKFGWQASNEQSWKELLSDFESVLQLDHLSIKGLMTMPPFTTIPSEAQASFRKLFQLKQFFEKEIKGISLPELSMGTSTDFNYAIAEGATMVRIGQAILGPRPPKKIIQEPAEETRHG